MINGPVAFDLQAQRRNLGALMDAILRQLRNVNARRSGTSFTNDIMASQYIDDGRFNSENQLAHEQFIFKAPAQINEGINNRLPRTVISDFTTPVCLDNR